MALLGVGWLWLPVGEWIEQFQQWILGLGFWGIVIFAGAFIVATLVLAPDWPLAVAAGMVYGLWAIPLVLAAAIVAASLAFLAARHLARRRVRVMLSTRPKFAAIDRAVAEEGWKIVFLLRLSPLVPFNVQNYLYGITAIPFLHYAAASFFGIVPGTALFVYLGAIGTTSGGPLQWTFSGVGLLATATVVVIVTHKARAQLAAIGVTAPP
ncbi:MAG TPA: VTT domain-containing protein [Stellaceae bacterium]|nr:VTT domain-containing protein [Stellaceae bacterium]